MVKNNNNKTRKLIKKINLYTKLPTPIEFRMTTFMEELLFDQKNKSKPITDEQIRQYMHHNLNTFQRERLIKEVKEIKEYINLKGKINFEPLTVELLRKKYWNSHTKKWMPIHSYYGDGGDPNDERFGPVYLPNVKDRNNRKKLFCNQFIPTGNLIEKNMKTLKRKTYKNWLKSNKIGPYKYKDYDYKNKQQFFYLDGKMKFCGDDQIYEDLGLQICQGNYVSDNCVGGPNWIETDKRMYI